MTTLTLKYLLERRARMLFELMFVFILLGALIYNAISGYQTALQMSSVTNSLAVITYLKTHMYYHYAMYGRWPDTRDLQDKITEITQISREIASIEIQRGNVVITYNDHYFHLNQHKLSFRKAQVANQTGTPVIWLCGREIMPEGMLTDIENVTDLPDNLLPRMCK